MTYVSWEENIYYNPQVHGLEIVGSVDDGGGYDFNMIVVWKNEESEFFVGTDSGCSCPSPFENYEGAESLTGPLTAAEVQTELEDWANVRLNDEYREYRHSDAADEYLAGEIADLILKVRWG